MLTKENVYVSDYDDSVLADETDNTINVELGFKTDIVKEVWNVFSDDEDWNLGKYEYLNAYAVYNPETKDVHVAVVLYKDSPCFVEEVEDYPMFAEEKKAIGEVIEEYVQTIFHMTSQELINQYK